MDNDLSLVLRYHKFDLASEYKIQSIIFKTRLEQLLAFSAKAVTDFLAYLFDFVLVELFTDHLGKIHFSQPFPGHYCFFWLLLTSLLSDELNHIFNSLILIDKKLTRLSDL